VPQGRFVDCSLEVCEERDSKGLYKKARSGDLKEFTGISSPYENPLCPEAHLRRDEMGIDECINKIIGYMVEAKIIKEPK
jgi:adenylylsulfate kinase